MLGYLVLSLEGMAWHDGYLTKMWGFFWPRHKTLFMYWQFTHMIHESIFLQNELNKIMLGKNILETGSQFIFWQFPLMKLLYLHSLLIIWNGLNSKLLNSVTLTAHLSQPYLSQTTHRSSTLNLFFGLGMFIRNSLYKYISCY